MNSKLKICLAASAGGHLTQLLKISDSWKGCDVVFVTTSNAVANELKKRAQTYTVGECNRKSLTKVVKVFWRCLRIIQKEKPNVILSTGAAAGCILCFLGKITGAKVIWLDSITNTQRLSLSGRMVRYIADLFFVQWPELATRYKNVEYIGTVI
jgi:UDP-N-acetylglucosamine:LPS N-acetylglucosamine transferase